MTRSPGARRNSGGPCPAAPRSSYVAMGGGASRWATPREATRWTLIHLGSGGAIARLTGRVATVMPVAAEIAECSDWTLFDLPEGWRQTDPGLPAKVGAICEAHPEVKPDTAFGGKVITDADARAVIDARERRAD